MSKIVLETAISGKNIVITYKSENDLYNKTGTTKCKLDTCRLLGMSLDHAVLATADPLRLATGLKTGTKYLSNRAILKAVDACKQERRNLLNARPKIVYQIQNKDFKTGFRIGVTRNLKSCIERNNTFSKKGVVVADAFEIPADAKFSATDIVEYLSQQKLTKKPITKNGRIIPFIDWVKKEDEKKFMQHLQAFYENTTWN